MILVRVVHELARHAAILQRVEQLERMVDVHAQVELAVNDQRRRIEVRCEHMGRVAVDALEVFPVLTVTLLVGAEVRRHVRVQVVDGCVRDERLERMRLAEQQRREIAAVAAAASREPVRIDPGLCGKPLRGLDRVLIGKLCPILGDRIRPGLAEAARPVEVVPGGDVAPVREHLCVPAPLHRVGHAVVRPAVKQQMQRPLAIGREVGWIDHPHLHVVAVRALVSDALDLALREIRERGVVEVGELRRCTGPRNDADERRWLGEALAQTDDNRPAAGNRERAEAAAAGHCTGFAAAQIESIHTTRAGIVDRAEERIGFG